MGAKAFLSKAFPFLSIAATTFGGPIGAMGASVLGAALGKEIKPEALESELTKLAGTEEGMLKAQQAEADFKIQMQKAGYAHVEELERVAAADRDSARQREIKTGDSWTPRTIAGIFVAGWFTVQWFILTHIIANEMRDVVMRTLGTLDMGLGLILGYYFGSSSGSARKDEIIANNTNGK